MKLQISIHLEKKYYVHNIFTIFSQQIVSGRLLLVVMSEQKNNLSCEFKLEPITNNLLHVICCENIVDVALHNLES